MVTFTVKSKQIEAEAKVIALFQSFGKNKKVEDSFFSQFKYIISDFRLKQNDKNFAEYNRVSQDIFLNTEQYCKNTVMFWKTAAYVWVEAGGSDARWLEAWGRYDRLDLEIGKRATLFGGSADIDKGKFAADLFRSLKSKEKITVYRAFSARSGKRIRAGEVKADKGYYVQEEGAGFSYSISKNEAAVFNRSVTQVEILKRHTDFSEEKMNKVRTQALGVGNASFWNNTDARFIGTYTVQKKDIVGAFFQRRNELEVVAKKSTLVRYEVTTAVSSLASYVYLFMRSQLNRSAEGKHKFISVDEADLRLMKVLQKGAEIYINKHGYADIFSDDGNVRRVASEVLDYAGFKKGVGVTKNQNGHLMIDFAASWELEASSDDDGLMIK
jgi:hypothetical protein